jgi:hypothetical protein
VLSRVTFIVFVATGLAGLGDRVGAQDPAPPASLPEAPPDPFGDTTGTPTNPARTVAQTEPWGASLFVDQDSVYPWLGASGGDQNYTMGVGLQLTGGIVRFASWPVRRIDSLFGLGRIHRRLRIQTTAFLPANTPSYYESHSLTFANGAFTPDRIEDPEPIFDDRPYSSIVGLTAAHSTIDPYGRRVLRTELTIGALGLGLSESIQTAIHTRRRENNQQEDPSAETPYDPEGWRHQISAGGELTGKYTATWLQALSESTPHDLTLHAEASLGYYTNAAVGFVGRLGWLRSDFWTVQTNPLTAMNQGLSADAAQTARAQGTKSRVPQRKRSRDVLEAYLFGAARARFVIYNELLQGGFKDSSVAFRDADVERIVREVDAGATLAYKGLSLTIALTNRSPEYRVGESRSHTWGGVYIMYRSH